MLYIGISIARSLFFNDTPTTEIYTLSLHDALPISRLVHGGNVWRRRQTNLVGHCISLDRAGAIKARSEEHTSELQSLTNLVCRLLLEKKKPVPNDFRFRHPMFDVHQFLMQQRQETY